MPPKSIECKVVKVLQEQKSQGGSNQLRVVRWLVDGKEQGAQLEKRNFYIDKSGEEKIGKAKGLSKDEVKYIVDSWKDIEKLMS
jgi:hypothetical protein